MVEIIRIFAPRSSTVWAERIRGTQTRSCCVPKENKESSLSDWPDLYVGDGRRTSCGCSCFGI